MHARAIREIAHELPAKPGLLGGEAPIEHTIKNLAMVSRIIRNIGLQDKRTVLISRRGRLVHRPIVSRELTLAYEHTC